jgi:hypothetical protein
VIAESTGSWKVSFPRINLEAICHEIRVVRSFIGARWPRPRVNIILIDFLS